MSIQVKSNGIVRVGFKPRSSVKKVLLACSFNQWEPIRLRKQKSGEYVANVQMPLGTHEYKFIVDDQWQVDPDNEVKVCNAFGAENSIVVVS